MKTLKIYSVIATIAIIALSVSLLSDHQRVQQNQKRIKGNRRSSPAMFRSVL